MFYDKELAGAKLRKWEKCLRDFSFPTWDELPDLDLYMDQVISLVGKYLDFLPVDETDGASVTASAINNYVRLRIMPAPVKKRYGRVHLAYLIIICSLKQSVNISYIRKMIPMELSEEEVRQVYDNYVATHKLTCAAFIENVRAAAAPILGDTDDPHPVSGFVCASAVTACLSRLLTQKMVMLSGLEYADMKNKI